MRAVILAAGQGSRLRPLTDDRPKCMVPLAGHPLLDYQRAVLRASGLEKIAIIGGYRAECIALEPSDVLLRNPRFDQTNMVYTLFCAEDWLAPDEDLVLCYGDIVFEPRILASVLACDAPVALATDVRWRDYWALRMSDPLADAETFRMDADGRVRELGKKPTGYEQIQGQYMGLFKVRADQVRRFRQAYHALKAAGHGLDGRDLDNIFMTGFIQHLIDTGWHVQAVPVENGWLEVDSVQDWEQYEAMEQRGELRRFCDLSQMHALMRQEISR